jgi:hypothetical protein
MRPSIVRWARQGGLAVVLSASVAFNAAAMSDAQMNEPPYDDVTAEDIAASNEKLASAYNALVKMWADDFQQLGASLRRPSRGIAATSVHRVAS